jgi:hypothetical protein
MAFRTNAARNLDLAGELIAPTWAFAAAVVPHIGALLAQATYGNLALRGRPAAGDRCWPNTAIMPRTRCLVIADRAPAPVPGDDVSFWAGHLRSIFTGGSRPATTQFS